MRFVDTHRTAGDSPTVSVVIPAYNAGRTIETALQSVFAQTYRDFEVIVVDDGSIDDTAERVRAWGDAVVLRRQVNGGPGAARNHGIQLARGRLLAFLDADDVWLPTKLQRQVLYFERYPETGLLHADAIVSRAPLSEMFDRIEDIGTHMAPPANDFCGLFHCNFYVRSITVMAPRDVVVGVGLFDERREFHVEDWDLWLRIAAKYPLGYLPMTLAIHRPDGGMSSNVEKTFRGQTLAIDKVLPLCTTACPRHREDPHGCLSARQHLLHSQLGYERFWRGHKRTAREAYKQALNTRPLDSRARCYIAASYVGRWSLRPLREIRNVWRRLQHSRRMPVPAPPPRDLFQDTTYRRTGAAITRAAHATDDALWKHMRRKRRVLFEAASPLSVAVFQPLYNRLRHDDRLEFWFTANDQNWDAPSIFNAANITERILPRDTIRWKKFDLYINTDFWNMTWLQRRTRRVHLFHGVAGKYGLDAPTSIAHVVATFDRLMFANLDRLNRYAEAGLVDPESARAALIGYPKVDCLVDGSLDRTQIMTALGIDRSRPTVLYAPTWSPHSSLNSSGEQVMRTLAAMGLNVVVKLHDRSLDGSVRGSGGVDWRARLRQLSREVGVYVADGADASRFLFIADLLVTDHSSVGFEYMLLDRPLVVLDSPELLRHSRVNPQKAELLRSAAHVVHGVQGLDTTVQMALAHPREHSARRTAIANELFYRPGTATDRAVQCIYQLLGLPSLVTVPAPGAVATSVPLTSFEMGARHT